MKHFLLAILLLAIFLPDCKKEPVAAGTPDPTDTIQPVDTTVQHIIELGQGSTNKNGTLWAAIYSASYHHNTKSRFYLALDKDYSDGLAETFAIQDIPFRNGRYNIEFATSLSAFNNSIPNAAYTLSNYDEGIGNFYPDTPRNDHFIEVLYCDTLKNEVEGRFQVFMGKNGGPSTVLGVPDSVFLTEGKFYLKLQ